MAYSRVTRTANGAEALAYAYGDDGKGHNGNEQRNQVISLVNLQPGVPVETQMSKYWDRAKPNHKTQVLRVVQSYSKKELNPDEPADLQKANMMGQELARKYYPGRQAVVFTQIDGASGLVHNHIIINDCAMEDTRGCNKNQYFYKQVEKWTDDIAAQYVDLDFGEKTKDKVTRTERVKRQQGEYVYKDDLKERVHAAMQEAESEEDFVKKLTLHGVDATKRNSKKYGEYYTYTLVDKSNVPEGEKLPNRELKFRSYNMGESYGLETLNEILKEKSSKVEVKDEVEIPKMTSQKAHTDTKKSFEYKSIPDEEKTPKNDFTAFCNMIGRHWISYNDNDQQVYDWDLYEELKKEWEEYKQQPDEPEQVKEEVDVVDKPVEVILEQVDEVEDEDAGQEEVQVKMQQTQQAVEELKKTRDEQSQKHFNARYEEILRKAREIEENAENDGRKGLGE